MSLVPYLIFVALCLALIVFVLAWLCFDSLSIPELVGLALFFDFILAVAFCYFILKGK